MKLIVKMENTIPGEETVRGVTDGLKEIPVLSLREEFLRLQGTSLLEILTFQSWCSFSISGFSALGFAALRENTMGVHFLPAFPAANTLALSWDHPGQDVPGLRRGPDSE